MSAEQRIATLQQARLEAPEQRENIDAIIKHYQNGGELPTPIKIVVAYQGEVRLSTIEEISHLLETKKDNSLPYYDVRSVFSALRECISITISPWSRGSSGK